MRPSSQAATSSSPRDGNARASARASVWIVSTMSSTEERQEGEGGNALAVAAEHAAHLCGRDVPHADHSLRSGGCKRAGCGGESGCGFAGVPLDGADALAIVGSPVTDEAVVASGDEFFAAGWEREGERAGVGLDREHHIKYGRTPRQRS